MLNLTPQNPTLIYPSSHVATLTKAGQTTVTLPASGIVPVAGMVRGYWTLTLTPAEGACCPTTNQVWVEPCPPVVLQGAHTAGAGGSVAEANGASQTCCA
jgi:hypothetical protein